MKRKLILAGNWKMYKTRGEAKAFIHELIPLVKHAICQIFIAPPFTAIAAAASSAQGTGIAIGAQNMHDAKEGAFTGEVSAPMLKEAGAQFVILGHSERRNIFGESDAFINRKLKNALEAGLKPILCIGELLEEHEAGKTKEALDRQLHGALEGVDVASLIIAYEPVWAIGTGIMATPEIAQEAHEFVRSWIGQKYGNELAGCLPILYGGSVKPETIETLVSMPDIDGALVGGASLEVKSFAQMANVLK